MIINTSFELNHATKLVFGPGTVKNAGEEAKAFGDKALIVCDKILCEVGVVDKVTASLEESGIRYVIFDDVSPNPRDTGCEAAAGLGKEFGASMVIAIGGGSPMDTGKVASVLISNGGRCQDWTWQTDNEFHTPLLPVICIPTTAGTGSEVTFEAVITDSETHVKMSLSKGTQMAPIVAIIDPELTVTVPPLVTAATGIDALVHALEAFTCTSSQPITDGLAIYAMEIIAKNLQAAVNDGTNIEARTAMMAGSVMAGMAFTNSFVGAVHSLAEILGAYYDMPHGIANAIFLPWVTEFNASANFARHGVVARCLGVDTHGISDEEASKLCVQKLFELNDKLGIPKFRDIKGVNPEDFEAIAKDCTSHPCTEGNAREIGYEQFLELLNKAYALH